MFGFGWEDGSATIVARQTHEGMYHGQGPTGLYHQTYDYVADVQPDGGGLPFRATFTELFTGDLEHRPRVGETVRVKLRAKDQKVKLDRDSLRQEAKASKDAARSEFDAIASAPPGSAAPADGPTAPAGSAPGAGAGDAFAQEAAAFRARAEAFRQRSATFQQNAELMMAIGQAKAAGDEAEVARLKATLAHQPSELPSSETGRAATPEPPEQSA